MIRTFHPGGIHPDPSKLAKAAATLRVGLPREVNLLLSQHIGAPARCIVKKGDIVKRGDLIAEAAGFVSANIHSPISGTVTSVGQVRMANGLWGDAVTVTASEDDHNADEAGIAAGDTVAADSEVDALTPQQILDKIGDAGIVGLGGATFPTKVKLMPPAGMVAELLIINASECEPYLTNDEELIKLCAPYIIKGIKLLMKAAKVGKAVIGIENNKPEGVRALEKALSGGDDSISVQLLRTRYPQGGEKQLIEAITGREVPSGAIPVSVGAIVQNVATAYAVYEAVYCGKPLIERMVTITGPSMAKNVNVIVPFGMKISDMINIGGGLPDDTGKVILGGPMMGRAVTNIDAPATKGTSAVLVLPERMSRRREVEPCIRCAACVNACPMGLEPYKLATLSRYSMWEEVEDNKVMNCIECGCCSYSCPSSRPLLDYIKLGKNKVGGLIKVRSAKS